MAERWRFPSAPVVLGAVVLWLVADLIGAVCDTLALGYVDAVLIGAVLGVVGWEVVRGRLP